MSKEDESVAAAMIRRFREAKPSSRAERDSAKVSGRVREMWWVDRNDGSNIDRRISSPHQSLDKQGVSMEIERPRPSPMKPTTSRLPPRASATMKSIDDLIMKDVMNLDDSFDWDNRRRNLFDEGPANSTDSLLKHRNAPMYRYARATEDKPTFQKTGTDLLNESLDTLGSLGFHGLNVLDLKLDGAKEPVDTKSDGQMQDVNASLEELLKSLGANKEALTKDGLPESIMQVYNDVNADLIGFKSKFEDKYEREEAEAKLRAERDEEMKNIGREEERENLMKQLTQMEIEKSNQLKQQEILLEASITSNSDSDYLMSSVDHAGVRGSMDAPADQQVYDLRSALQAKMRYLEELHADAMKETVYNDKGGMEAVGNVLGAPAKHALPSRLTTDPFLNIPSGGGRAHTSIYMGSRSKVAHKGASHRARKHRRGEDDADRGADELHQGYMQPGSAGGNAPGILHDCVVSAAKYISVNLNVAMDGLLQRFPHDLPTPAPPTVAPLPSYEDAVKDPSPSRLPTYDELHPNFAALPQLPSYEEIAGTNNAEAPRDPNIPSAKYIPPLTEAEKMARDIDSVLGPVDSSVEVTELTWWRQSHNTVKNDPRGKTAPQDSTCLDPVSRSASVNSHGAPVRDIPWLQSVSTNHVISSSRPSAPFFPLPSPPAMPTPSVNTIEFGRQNVNYTSNSQIKYNAASEGLSIISVRVQNIKETKKPIHISGPFSVDAPNLRSPDSVTVGDIPMSEREMYLKKMQHYRRALSGSLQ